MTESLIHIVHDWDDKSPISVVVACCARTAIIDEEGEVHPSDFDFVEPPWEEQATCPKCLERAPSVVKERTEDVTA